MQERAEDAASPQVMGRIEQGFGERVRESRQRAGLSQRQLADALNLDASAISRLEQGGRAIRLGEAVLIAESLKTDVQQLIYGYRTDLVAIAAEVERVLTRVAGTAEEARDALVRHLRGVREVHELLTNGALAHELRPAFSEDNLANLISNTAADSERVKALEAALVALEPRTSDRGSNGAANS